MSVDTATPGIADDEITLRDVVATVWNRRWLVLAITLFMTLAMGAAALVMPKQYEATVLISPATSSPGAGQGGGLGALASQFGGLASLAGLSLGADNKKSEAIAVLQSEALTEAYVRDANLLPVIFHRQWDAAANSWKVMDADKVPTLWRANVVFKNKIRTVATDAKTGLVTLTIKWRDAATAAKWANELVSRTNDLLRARAIAESERNIAFLSEQASKTDVVGVRQALFNLLQSEIGKVMVARGNDEYALRVIDPAFVPQRPASPQPLYWLLAGLFGGLCASVCAVVMVQSWK